MKTTIEIWGATLDVLYDYYPYVPATYESPEEGGEIELIDILHMDISIFDLVSEIKNYEDKIIEELKKNRNENND